MSTAPLIGFLAKQPYQWVQFLEQWPGEGAQTDAYQGTYSVNRMLVEGLSYSIATVCPWRSERVDVWRIAPNLDPGPEGFDCDDFALTLRHFCKRLAGGSATGLWPILCQRRGADHMMLIVNFEDGAYVYDHAGGVPWQEIRRPFYDILPLIAYVGQHWRWVY